MMDSLKLRALLILDYLGDAAHRRAVVGAALMLCNHLFGWTNDEAVLLSVDTIFGLVLAAWSSRTPKISVGDDPTQ